MHSITRSRLCDGVALATVFLAFGLVASALDPRRVQKPEKEINIFLIGRAGSGKSFVGNHMVQTLLNSNRSDVAMDAPEEWIRGFDGLWKQCDCDGCPECPVFKESSSTSSSTSNVTASTVVWAKPSLAHVMADEFPSAYEDNNIVTRIRVFDSPGIPDTDPKRMAEYHDALIKRMSRLRRVDAIVWVQSDVRVGAADRGFRVLLQQFHSFPARLLLVNGKGHYRKSSSTPTRKEKRPDKDTYRAQLVADWTRENEVGLGWHGQMFVSVDAEELDATVLPQVIAHILAMSSSRHSTSGGALEKLKVLDVLWHDLVTHFIAITKREEVLAKHAEDLQIRLMQIDHEIRTLDDKMDWRDALMDHLGFIGEHLRDWVLRRLSERSHHLRARRKMLSNQMHNILADIYVTEYVSERAEEIRDLCALLAKPDCPDVGKYIQSSSDSKTQSRMPLRKCAGPVSRPKHPLSPQ